jgi:hypothetical protein
VNVRPVARVAREQPRDNPGADALVDPEAQRPRLAVREGAEVGLGGLDPRDDRLRVAEEHLAGLGQLDRARAARAFDEPLADDPFERRDLLADRRLDVAESRGGAPEGALLGDGFERRQVADLDPRYMIGGHGHPQRSRSF